MLDVWGWVGGEAVTQTPASSSLRHAFSLIADGSQPRLKYDGTKAEFPFNPKPPDHSGALSPGRVSQMTNIAINEGHRQMTFGFHLVSPLKQV